ncbi:MAG: DEAD/DEAH box helicase [Acidobacteriota bacterium]|nr:DEAD/DEAH box helicase [Acidobacteriota bacterium]
MEDNPLTSFAEMPLRDELKQVLARAGFETPTPIQARCIPLATAGRDITGVAQTGTGKTLAFLVPIFDALEPCDDVQAMVICPTRELAQQVGSVARDIGEPLGVKTAVLYGGTSLGGQQNELRELPDVVVGTPGRLMDFLSSAWLRPRRLRWLVLDEADRMLDMGFIDDVVKICSRLPLSRQTMLFSATMPPPIEELTSRFMYEPEVVRIDAQTRVAAGVDHCLYWVQERDKEKALAAVMDRHRGKKALIFTATREATSQLAARLRRHGHEVISLSSLHSQNNRERALDAFRKGDVPVMVATDVAARGIDVTDIDLVVNFDLPRGSEEYIHRVGRTGRAERAGSAVSLAAPGDEGKLAEIEKMLGEPIPRQELPGIETPARGSYTPRRSGRGGGSREGGRRRRPGRGGRGRGKGQKK